MTYQEHNSINRRMTTADGEQPLHDGNDGATHKSSLEDLARLAGMIASGEVAVPYGLNAANQTKVLMLVARLRRTRLIKFFAHAIASDIARSRRP